MSLRNTAFNLFGSLLLLLLLLGTTNAAEVLSLTPGNYDTATANKIVMIKFFAPWCPHCQEMAPDWERLADDYRGSDKYLVAEVDCTTPETEDWCDEVFEIEGFPTVLYGDPGMEGALMEEYDGDRDYETMSAFATEMFAKPLCNVQNLDGCTDEKRVQLESFLKLSEAEIDARILKMEQEMEQIDEEYEDKMDELQDQYDELATDHQIFIDNLSRQLRIVREVKEIKGTTAKTE